MSWNKTAAGEPGAMPPAPAGGGPKVEGMPNTPGPGVPIASGDQAEETRVPPAGASEPALPFPPARGTARVKESEKERVPPTSPHGATQPGGGSIGGRSGSVGRGRS